MHGMFLVLVSTVQHRWYRQDLLHEGSTQHHRRIAYRRYVEEKLQLFSSTPYWKRGHNVCHQRHACNFTHFNFVRRKSSYTQVRTVFARSLSVRGTASFQHERDGSVTMPNTDGRNLVESDPRSMIQRIDLIQRNGKHLVSITDYCTDQNLAAYGHHDHTSPGLLKLLYLRPLYMIKREKGSMGPPGEIEMIVSLVALVPLGVLIMTYFRGRWRRPKTAQDAKESQRTRPMEFGSSFMFLGVWPTDTAMPQAIVTAFIYLDQAPDAFSVETACSKMLRFDNFRSLPQRCRRRWFLPAPTTCEWREIEVEPADIITRVRVEGSAMVLREMERIKDSVLPRFSEDGRKQLPLWGLHVIENTNLREGSDGLGSVVVFRFHHTIGDGISLVAVARDVLESAASNDDRPPRTAGVGVGEALATDPRSDLKTFSRIGIGKTLSAIRDVVGQTLAASDTPLPFGHLEAPIARGRHGELWDPIPSGRIEGRKAFSGRRRIILFPDIPLSLIRTLKEKGGAKVNDVMICLFSGCIRRYCKAMGAGGYMGGKGFKSTAIIPVALPRAMDAEDKATLLCNRWGLASTPLYLDEENPVIRLEKIKVASTKMKGTFVGAMNYLLQAHVMPRLPLSVCRTMVYNSVATHTLFLSNVPGPQEATRFAGRRLRRIHFCFRNLMPQVGVMSLDGAVGANLVVDPVATPESLSLPSHYIDELKALMASLGVEDAKALEEAEGRRDRMTRTMMEAADLKT